MPEPIETPENEKGGYGYLWLWVFVLILVGYPLSAGPVSKLYQHGVISGTTIQTIYAPLIYLTDASPFVGEFFEWYLGKVWHFKEPPPGSRQGTTPAHPPAGPSR